MSEAVNGETKARSGIWPKSIFSLLRSMHLLDHNNTKFCWTVEANYGHHHPGRLKEYTTRQQRRIQVWGLVHTSLLLRIEIYQTALECCFLMAHYVCIRAILRAWSDIRTSKTVMSYLVIESVFSFFPELNMETSGFFVTKSRCSSRGVTCGRCGSGQK